MSVRSAGRSAVGSKSAPKTVSKTGIKASAQKPSAAKSPAKAAPKGKPSVVKKLASGFSALKAGRAGKPSTKIATKPAVAAVVQPAAKAGAKKVGVRVQSPSQVQGGTGKLSGSKAQKKLAANAAAVERVTERLMGRIAAEPLADSVCREVACEGLGTSAGYCRLHYIKNWKKIKRKDVILKEGKLNQYIEELVGKYPEKYIEAIRQDLANDKEFAKVIVDLDLDEGDEDFEAEGTNADADVGIDTLKREFEEEPDAF
ncbi:MAG: hypothetical protein ACK5QT_11210 [Oligoflexia bacterium]|jgi:hypothetical protein